MSYGAPDFTQKADVNVVGQTVTVEIKIVGSSINVPIDIVAQSLGNLKIDIAAASIGTLNVDIVGQTVGNIKVDIAAQSVGNIGVDIKAQTIGNIKIDLADVTFTGSIKIDIAAQSIGNININLADVSFAGNLNVNIASQDITLNINVTNEVLKTGGTKSCLIFDGEDDYVDITFLDAVEEWDELTVVLWAEILKTPDQVGDSLIGAPAWSSEGGFLIYMGTTGEVRARLRNHPLGTEVRVKIADVELRKKRCYAFVFNRPTLKTYLDGAYTGNSASWDNSVRTDGHIRLATWDHDYQQCKIYNLLVYNKALSDDEISNIYSNPNSPPAEGLMLWCKFDEGTGNTLHDYSGRNKHGTIYGAIWGSEEGSVSASLNINIKAQTVGISIQAEWQTQIGNQKIITGEAVAVASDTDADVINYTVPSGKTLFIYAVSVKGIISGVGGSAPRGSWEFLIAGNYVWDANTNDNQPSIGQSFPVPLRANAGETVIVRVHNYESGSASFVADIDAFEV